MRGERNSWMGSGADDLVEPFYDLGGLFRGSPAESLADPFDAQRSDLTDLHPRSFRKAFGFQFEGQRESGPLGLDCDCYCDCSAGSFVEDVLTQDQDRPLSGLLASPNRIQVAHRIINWGQPPNSMFPSFGVIRWLSPICKWLLSGQKLLELSINGGRTCL